MTKIVLSADSLSKMENAQTSGDENEDLGDRKQRGEFLQAPAEVLQTEKTFLSICHLARGLPQASTSGTEAQRHSTVQSQARHGPEATSFAGMPMVSAERRNISSHLPDTLQSSI